MKTAEQQRIDEVAEVWAATDKANAEPETFWDGFKMGFGFWTFWLRVKPSAKDLGGVVATLLYFALVLLMVHGFWSLVY